MSTTKFDSKTPASNYTKPNLRSKLKQQIMAGDKGGRKKQWSARKSQLLASEYEKKGGGYQGGKSKQQKSLDKWTKESWQTKDNHPRARHGKETERYLPEKAWEELSQAQKRATDQKKRAASRKGKQRVANTAPARRARSKAKV